MDWRKLEAKLVDLIRKQGCQLNENWEWDKCIKTTDHPLVNLTQLARDLAWELTNDPV